MTVSAPNPASGLAIDGMSNTSRATIGFFVFFAMIALVGFVFSWNVALSILNLCLISAVMALGVNIQWGYAGLFNVGIMGFAALGGAAAVLTSKAPVGDAWAAGGFNLLGALLVAVLVVGAVLLLLRAMVKSRLRSLLLVIVVIGGYFAVRTFYDPAVQAIEAVDPAATGYLGGAGLPIIFSWAVGGVFAALAAWLIGKVALGLRSDYLAIATLGIAEIVIAIMKNEDWLTRGVKNVTALPRPVPFELQLQDSPNFIAWVEWFYSSALAPLSGEARADALREFVVTGSSIFVKLCYAGLFSAVLITILLLCVLALASPWGRMVRAIRDNEVSAAAMGKDVTRRHLQIFILGSAVVGIAGAMLTTLDGLFTPTSYQPLRFTFLIWVMVIVGGAGNNLGAVLGAFIVWFIWTQAEPAGNWLMAVLTSGFDESSEIRRHLMNSAQHMRLVIMGAVMLLVMRFSPGGILPERAPKPR